jgi:hypothetical protein
MAGVSLSGHRGAQWGYDDLSGDRPTGYNAGFTALRLQIEAIRLDLAQGTVTPEAILDRAIQRARLHGRHPDLPDLSGWPLRSGAAQLSLGGRLEGFRIRASLNSRHGGSYELHYNRGGDYSSGNRPSLILVRHGRPRGDRLGKVIDSVRLSAEALRD